MLLLPHVCCPVYCIELVSPRKKELLCSLIGSSTYTHTTIQQQVVVNCTFHPCTDQDMWLWDGSHHWGGWRHDELECCIKKDSLCVVSGIGLALRSWPPFLPPFCRQTWSMWGVPLDNVYHFVFIYICTYIRIVHVQLAQSMLIEVLTVLVTTVSHITYVLLPCIKWCLCVGVPWRSLQKVTSPPCLMYGALVWPCGRSTPWGRNRGRGSACQM